MPINGFNKTTLLDYPGKIAATIFLGSCNFRCPFCHNSGLVLSPGEQPVIPTEDVLKVLKKRQGILEGVCICLLYTSHFLPPSCSAFPITEPNHV